MNEELALFASVTAAELSAFAVGPLVDVGEDELVRDVVACVTFCPTAVLLTLGDKVETSVAFCPIVLLLTLEKAGVVATTDWVVPVVL